MVAIVGDEVLTTYIALFDLLSCLFAIHIKEL